MKKIITPCRCALLSLMWGLSLPLMAQAYEPVELDVLSMYDEYPFLNIVSGDIDLIHRGYEYDTGVPLFGAHIAHHAVEMMWKYGTTKHSVEEYRRLATVNYVLIAERSSNHAMIDYIYMKEGEDRSGANNNHASKGFNTIWQYVDHFRPYACNNPLWNLYMTDLILDLKEWYGDDVRIVSSNSTGSTSTTKPSSDWINAKPCYQSPNMISFTAIGNVSDKFAASCHYDSDLPEELDKIGYTSGSFANPPDTFKVRNYAVVGMNYLMDHKVSEWGSLFPYGYDNDYVFGSCTMPFISCTNGYKVVGEAGSQHSSYNATSTAARAILCAQVWPDFEEIQEIIDYFAKTRRDNKVPVTWLAYDLHADITCIRLDEFFRDKSMPTEVPTEVLKSGYTPLPRGLYPGILYCGPGVEVKAGDQWIAVTKENQARIEQLDAMNLECRFSPTLAMNQGYGPKVEIEAIAIDDTFLALDKGVKHTIAIVDEQNLDEVAIEQVPNGKVMREGRPYIVKDGRYYLPDGRAVNH